MKRIYKTCLLVAAGLIIILSSFDKLTNSPRFQLLGEYVSRIETERKRVALTFDDGPMKDSTANLLKTLEALNVKASFFLVGRQIEKYPVLAAEIVSAGHQVGNHSYSHQRMIYEMPGRYRAEIEKTDALIRAAGYRGEISFRAPFGRKFLVLPYLLREYGKVDVLWDVDPKDYEASGVDALVSSVLANVRPGSIVLLHDRPNTVAALGKLVKGLRDQGFELVTVEELSGISRKRNL